MSKNNEETEKEPIKIVYSPGFLVRNKNLVFEQIKRETYVMYNFQKGMLQIAENNALTSYYDSEENITYLPLTRVPWPLSTPKITFTLLEEADLWMEVKQFIYDHVDMIEEELYDVLTAWVFATYLPEVWMVVPYVFAYGAVSTGKTRLLEALQILSYRGIIGSNVSSASLFRGCEQWHPTVFLDETEIYSKVEHAEVIGLLNAGYRRGQFAWRVKNTEQGTELELFDVFGFKGLSGTEGLAKTLESRSIKIRMIKNTRPVRFLVDQAKAEKLRAKLSMWRFLKLHKIFGEGYEGYEPYLEVPPLLKFANGRLVELFQPLLAVANNGYENIVNYAKKVYEMRQLEEEVSVEAMILNALLNSESKVEEKVILTCDIAETLNKDIPKKEQFKNTTVGKIMRRLGFLPKHTMRGNGWIWNDKRVELLRKRYVPEGTPPELPSLPSLPSQPSQSSYDLRIQLNQVSPSEPAERCEQCGEFPVAYKFLHKGQEIRRCKHCIEKMQNEGLKFTTLTEVNDV